MSARSRDAGGIKELCKENQEGHNHTKMCIERVEQTVKDIKDQLTEHEERIEKGSRENKLGGRYNNVTPEGTKVPASP